MKPLLKWAGGKSQLFSQFQPIFPKHFHRYVEPFFGSGAVFWAMEGDFPAEINDQNYELVHLYKTVRDSPSEFCQILDTFSQSYGENFYYDLRKNIPENPVQQAARTLFLNKTCYNGLCRYNKEGKFNVPFGKRRLCPKLYSRENVFAVSQKLKAVQICHEDFEKIVDRAQHGDFVYCDPPYEPISSTSSFRNYTAGGFSREDQKRLHASCVRAVKRGALVFVSNSSAVFIKNLYKNCEIHKISARRAINCVGSKRDPIEEFLIRVSSEDHPS